MKQYKRGIVAIGAFGLVTFGHCQAGWANDYLMGDIFPLQPGTSAIGAYYLYGHNDEFNANGQTYSKDTGLETHVGIVRAIHNFDLGGMQVQQNIILPYGTLRNGEIGGAELGSTTGFGDVQLATQIWPISDPERGSYVGLGATFNLPTGSYDPGSPLNIGTNRWSGDLTLAGSQRFADVWRVEGYLDWTTYGNNDRAGLTGSQTLKQDDSYQAQFYLVRNFGPATSVGLGYSINWGGVVSLDDIKTGEQLQKQQLRFTVNQFLSPTSLITVQLSHDFAVEGGFRQNLGLTMRVARLF